MPEPYRLSIRENRSLSLFLPVCLSLCLSRRAAREDVFTHFLVSLGHRWVCCAKKFAVSENLKPISMTFHELLSDSIGDKCAQRAN